MLSWQRLAQLLREEAELQWVMNHDERCGDTYHLGDGARQCHCPPPWVLGPRSTLTGHPFRFREKFPGSEREAAELDRFAEECYRRGDGVVLVESSP